MEEKLDISVVVPAYNEEESLEELAKWISRVMESHGFRYELLFIDDGSEDGTWSSIQNLSSSNSSIKGFRFNRNYGKSAALDAGFGACNGQVVITMDADLQDSPEEIPELYQQIRDQKLDLISGWKKKRRDPVSKRIPSKFFNLVTRIISGISLHDFNCGLKAYRLDVVKNIHLYGEMHRYIPVLAKWSGYKKINEKVVNHHPRKYGKTKYGMERFVFGFLDLLSISFVYKFRKRPMHFFGLLGSISFLIGLVFTLKIIWDKLNSIYFLKIPLKREITEQPLFFLALVAIVIGVQLFLAGFLSELITQQQVGRKEYLISERS